VDIVLLGLVIGMANALLAAGIVLVYMSNRTLNLAHGELGAFGVAMMLALSNRAHLNYWLALAGSLAAAGALGAVIERGVLRRLFRSPRLIVLIATIGVAQLVIVARLILPKPGTANGHRILAGGANLFPVPIHFKPVVFGRVVLLPQHFMVLFAGPVLALALFAFLRWSAYGVALRAAAENSQRARLLGIPVRRVSTMAWVLAALLSAAGGILLAPVIGFSSTEAVGLPLLMRGLAAATITGMDSVGAAFGAGLALGVIDQLVFFWTGRSGLTDVVLLVVIVVALLWRRSAFKRTSDAEESSWDAIEPVRSLPPEIATHPRWRATVLASRIALALAVVAVPLLLTSASTFFMASVALVAVVVVSATVLTGWAGQLSIGQWAMAGVGGVLGSKLAADMHVPFWAAFVLAALLGGVFALVLGIPALRLEGMTLAVVTLAFAVASASWLFEQPWFRPRTVPVHPGYLTTRGLYVASIALLLLTVVVTKVIERSRLGRSIVAVRDNAAQASSFGISVVRTKLTAFAISGMLAAAAGYLWVVGIGSARGAIFPPIRSLSVLAAAVIGGMGSVFGAVVGAAYMWGVPYFLGHVSPYAGLLSSGLGLLALVLFLPGGLVRPLVGARDLLARLVTGQSVRTATVEAGDAAEPVPVLPNLAALEVTP
jgi:ABC-type branched-subunit amino acid transport system permease subunit